MNQAAQANRPTIALVHGAFAESASWNGVISALQERGYGTIAIANPLRDLQEDAAYVRSVLESLPGPVVVAGHSYGGSVMSEAAEGLANVQALVFVASFILEAGESTGELANKFPGNQLGSALAPRPFPLSNGGTGTDLYIQTDKFHDIFAADVAADNATLMAATQRPIAAVALEGKASHAAWKTIPSWSLVTLQDLAVPAEAQRFMAERAGATAVEIDASHAVTVSRPAEVADLIDTAAQAATGSSTPAEAVTA